MLKFITLIQNIEGKKKYLLSFFFGALVTLALPPVYIIPAAIVGFTAHLWQLDRCKNKKQAFWLGWWFGWGHFTSGLYWISFALLVDAKQFGWMVPFAVFGIPAVIAIYTAIVSTITFIIPVKGYRKVISFAVLWTLIELLRGYLFTGFPWNLTGYIWSVSDNMLQLAGITGVLGLSFFTVLAFAMPYSIESRRVKDLIPTIASFAILVVIWVGGYYRLQGADEGVTSARVRIVQANINQDHKWDLARRTSIVERYLRMTKSAGFEDITHVIWPESALPFFMEKGSGLISAIKDVVPEGGFVITGSMHAQRSRYGFVEKIWNSVHVIGDKGDILDVYNKHHLVPFGEYVPFRSILPIDKITPGQNDFSKGDGAKTVRISGFPSFSPLICYEAIFPYEAVNKDDRPELMVNVTNDAWYGNSSGPYQHFNMVRMRAVEQGLPLIRAANTGISAVFDSYGRVVAKTELGEKTVLDEYVPYPSKARTLYSLFGDYIILILMVFFAIPVMIKHN